MIVERLLVRLPNWLGDALMARPLVHALRTAHARATITAVGPPVLLDLLAADAAWDRAEPLPLTSEAWSRLRSTRAEVAVICPPSFSSAWMALRLGVPRRVGFRSDGRAWLLTDALPRAPRGDVHLASEYAMLGERVGARPAPWRSLPVPAERARFAPAGGTWVVLGPGAIYGPAKRWPAEAFAEVGRRLARAGHAVLVCGAAADADVCSAVARGIGVAATSLAGRTSLVEQAALCAGASAVVCNDSGLAHLAGAVGAPTVTVFGSTSSAWTAPLGPRVRVVQHPPVCAPCFRRTCAIGYACLNAVGVDEVVDACTRAAA